MHDQARGLRHPCHDGGFQVFRMRQRDKCFRVFNRCYNSHTLLRFRNSEFCTAETVIFFKHSIKVNVQSVGKFADSPTHAARAEIVAPFDHARRFPVPEKPLQLAFRGRVALLNLCPASFNGCRIVRF